MLCTTLLPHDLASFYSLTARQVSCCFSVFTHCSSNTFVNLNFQPWFKKINKSNMCPPSISSFTTNLYFILALLSCSLILPKFATLYQNTLMIITSLHFGKFVVNLFKFVYPHSYVFIWWSYTLLSGLGTDFYVTFF